VSTCCIAMHHAACHAPTMPCITACSSSTTYFAPSRPSPSTPARAGLSLVRTGGPRATAQPPAAAHTRPCEGCGAQGAPVWEHPTRGCALCAACASALPEAAAARPAAAAPPAAAAAAAAPPAATRAFGRTTRAGCRAAGEAPAAYGQQGREDGHEVGGVWGVEERWGSACVCLHSPMCPRPLTPTNLLAHH